MDKFSPEDTSSPKSIVIALSAFLVFQAIGLMSVCGFRPPRPVFDADETEFSAERAMQHVREIAREPHPLGSEENARVRRYLMGVLSEMGLKPEVHTSGSGNWKLANLLCRIDGSDSTGVIMLAAHYDSVSAGPGAGDDGAAVAALLEVYRLLVADRTAGNPLRNDIILLISDGEEKGMLGAEAFVQNHPWAKEITLVLNFEGRGCRGPAFMFETSGGNGRLIEEFSRVVPSPVSSSLADRVYQLLPNNTDFTIFKQAGMAGYNFAFVDGAEVYHTENDNVENLSRHSLQHHGEQALALVRHFGGMPLEKENLRTADCVWFSLPGKLLIVYSILTARLTSTAVFILSAVYLFLGFRRRTLSWTKLFKGFSGILVDLQVVFIGGLLLWLGAEALAWIGLAPSLAQGESLRSPLVVLALWNVSLLLLWWIGTWMSESGDRPAAGLVLFSTVAVVTGWWMPEVSYLTVWPAAAALLSLVIDRFTRTREGRVVRSVLLLAASVPILVVLLSHQYFFYLAASRWPGIAILTVMVPSAMTFSLLQPQWQLIFRPGTQDDGPRGPSHRARRDWPAAAWGLAAMAYAVVAWTGV